MPKILHVNSKKSNFATMRSTHFFSPRFYRAGLMAVILYWIPQQPQRRKNRCCFYYLLDFQSCVCHDWISLVNPNNFNWSPRQSNSESGGFSNGWVPPSRNLFRPSDLSPPPSRCEIVAGIGGGQVPRPVSEEEKEEGRGEAAPLCFLLASWIMGNEVLISHSRSFGKNRAT